MKIVYFDVEDYEKEYLKKHNVNKYNYILTPDALNDLSPLKQEYEDVDVISVFTTSRVNRNILKKFKNLKLIALRSVGYNHIDIEYCREHHIIVENSPNYGNQSVAEFALALLMDVLRKTTVSYLEYKDAKVFPSCLNGMELFGKTMGIVGLGAIGSTFARISHGLGMKILGFDKLENENLKKDYGVIYTDFDTLLKKSDFISIHAPLNKENYHMFDEKSFDKMKNTAIIINTGRGELIDTSALFNALVNKTILGAGLDVLENEQIITDVDYMLGINRLDKLSLKQTIINSRLFQLDNVILTPHIAYNTQEAIQRILDTTMDNIRQFAIGNIQNYVE